MYICSNCNSDDVSAMKWVNLNTDEISEGEFNDEDTHCNSCDKAGTAEFTTVDVVEDFKTDQKVVTILKD